MEIVAPLFQNPRSSFQNCFIKAAREGMPSILMDQVKIRTGALRSAARRVVLRRFQRGWWGNLAGPGIDRARQFHQLLVVLSNRVVVVRKYF